jgi:hypothetical protein
MRDPDFDDGESLARVLERLAAETRADDAVDERRRAGWLGRQAEEEATLAGVLVDLAERGGAIVVTTTAGRNHRGRVRAVGRDFVVVGTDPGRDVLVRFAGVAQVRSHSRHAVLGDQPLLLEADFDTTVRSLGRLRLRVLAGTGGRAALVGGELRWVGRDVAAVRLEGPGTLTYLPLATLVELSATDGRLEPP